MTPSLRTDVAANARTGPTDAVSSAQCQHEVINADGVKVNAPCRLRRRKFWKFDYEMVHSEVYLNKYVVSMAPFSTPSCLTSHHSYHFTSTLHSENCCSFACFRFLIFHTFFQGVSRPHLSLCADAHGWCCCCWWWSDMELRHWVTGSIGHLGHLSRPGHRVIIWPGVRPEFFRFSEKCTKFKTYVWNAEMTKVIVRCMLLDWNHWMSVHAMNF